MCATADSGLARPSAAAVSSTRVSAARREVELGGLVCAGVNFMCCDSCDDAQSVSAAAESQEGMGKARRAGGRAKGQ